MHPPGKEWKSRPRASKAARAARAARAAFTENTTANMTNSRFIPTIHNRAPIARSCILVPLCRRNGTEPKPKLTREPTPATYVYVQHHWYIHTCLPPQLARLSKYRVAASTGAYQYERVLPRLRSARHVKYGARRTRQPDVTELQSEALSNTPSS